MDSQESWSPEKLGDLLMSFATMNRNSTGAKAQGHLG